MQIATVKETLTELQQHKQQITDNLSNYETDDIPRSLIVQEKILTLLIGIKEGQHLTISGAAKKIGSNRSTVIGWVERYEAAGLDVLLAEKKGIPGTAATVDVPMTVLEDALAAEQSPLVRSALRAFIAIKSGKHARRSDLCAAAGVHPVSLSNWLEQLQDAIEQTGDPEQGLKLFADERRTARPRIPVGGKELKEGGTMPYQFTLPLGKYSQELRTFTERLYGSERGSKTTALLHLIESGITAPLASSDPIGELANKNGASNNILCRVPYDLAVELENIRNPGESDMSLMRRVVVAGLTLQRSQIQDPQAV